VSRRLKMVVGIGGILLLVVLVYGIIVEALTAWPVSHSCVPVLPRGNGSMFERGMK
jgi:hypothetical protein